jgi:hypothetical protein
MTPVKSVFLPTILVCLIMTWPAMCQVKGKEDEQTARYVRLVKASGIEAQIKSIPKALLAVIPADIFPDVRSKSRVENLYWKKIGQGDSLPCILKALQEKIDENTLRMLLGFYESRLGRKVARLQEGSLDPSRLRGIREGYKRLSTLEEPRLSLVKRLTPGQSLSRTNPEWTRTVVAGLLEGYTKGEIEESTTHHDVDKIIEYGMKIARDKADEMSLLSAVNTFESLSDSELGEVASFYESDASMGMQEAFESCLKTALFDAAWTFGRCFRETTTSAPSGRPLSSE